MLQRHGLIMPRQWNLECYMFIFDTGMVWISAACEILNLSILYSAAAVSEMRPFQEKQLLHDQDPGQIVTHLRILS